jgi:hypothetical protein
VLAPWSGSRTERPIAARAAGDLSVPGQPVVGVLHGARGAQQLQLLPGWPPGGRNPRLNPEDARAELESGVSELIGYGAGLTPDGDDYLLGYLASLWPWQHLGAISAHLKLLRPAIKSRLHRTTSISRHYLELALQGHYSQSIDHLTTVLIHGSTPADIKLSAINVIKFGSSSGADCLGGFLHGIRALGKVEQEEMNQSFISISRKTLLS